MKHSQALAILLLTMASYCLNAADHATTFDPPKEFRMITFAEYGGGPTRIDQADAFLETVKAIGKESGANSASTPFDRANPHISLTLSQGNRGHSFDQSASYMVEDGKFKLDVPEEKPTGKQAPPGFHQLVEFLTWADQKLIADDYEALIKAQSHARDIEATMLAYLKKLDSDMGGAKLAKVFEGREFPKDATTFKLGGCCMELKHCHIDFKKEGESWQIARIWQCR